MPAPFAYFYCLAYRGNRSRGCLTYQRQQVLYHFVVYPRQPCIVFQKARNHHKHTKGAENFFTANLICKNQDMQKSGQIKKIAYLPIDSKKYQLFSGILENIYRKPELRPATEWLTSIFCPSYSVTGGLRLQIMATAHPACSTCFITWAMLSIKAMVKSCGTRPFCPL